MNAQELRIGNWVLIDGKPERIDSIVTSSSNFLYDGVNAEIEDGYYGDYSVMVKDPEPIPITPEILEKAGFEFESRGVDAFEQIWSCNGIEIWQHDEGFSQDYSPYSVDIKHLHQLQNLYFALTGEELDIEL